MNTLREIGAFVGQEQVGMRRVGEIVPLLTNAERTSMRAMISGLQNLPPINLEAEPVGDRFGEVPFAPQFRIHPSGGVVLRTLMILYANGPQPDETAEIGLSGVFAPLTLRFVGIFLLEVRRVGITKTGVTVLSKNFHVEGVEKPQPTPPSPVPPVIEVKSKGDGSFVVSGNGFVGDAVVAIRIVRTDHPLDPGASAVLTATALKSGKLPDFPTGNLCTQLPPGDRLSFSANDGRLDQSNHDLTSNTVTISCPIRP